MRCAFAAKAADVTEWPCMHGNWSGTAEAALLSLNKETEAFFIDRASTANGVE